jgi:alpha-tubulin suppressor-like RCC1 family protein
VSTRYQQIEALKDVDVEQVAAGAFHGHALSLGGKELFSWGKSNHGQLGLAENKLSSIGYEHTPTKVDFADPTAVNIIGISCGAQHSFALFPPDEGEFPQFATSKVYSWGHTEGRDVMATGHRAPPEKEIYSPKKLALQKVKGLPGQSR